MNNDRRVGLGFGALLFVATAAFAAFMAPPEDAEARGHARPTPSAAPPVAGPSAGPTVDPEASGFPATPVPAASGTPLSVPAATSLGGRALNPGQPTPFPLNTLAPLDGNTALPYPAYGTPVPGINAGAPAPDVPATISLRQAILVGFARSPALAVAREDVNVQAAEVRLAGAGLLPSLGAGSTVDYDHTQPGGTTNFGTGTTGTGTTGAGTGGTFVARTTSRNASFNLTLSQLIYDGGRIGDAVKAAGSLERVQADTYRRDLETVAYDVATAYYNYLAAERLTQVDLEIVRQDQVQVNLVTAQVRAGTAARSDIATVQLPLSQARLAVVRAQGSQLSSEAAFANAMGLDANVKVQPVDDAPVFTSNVTSSVPLPTYDAAVTRALALRPDFDAAERSVDQNQYSLRQARLGLFPTLSGSASASDASTDGRASTFRNSQTLGVSLSVPIYDQGITSANVAAARANVNVAFANLQNARLTVQLNVKQSLTNLVSSSAALDQTQQEYRTAVINVQATQAQYRAGVTTLPLLLNAQVQLTQALTDQVTAVYTLRQAEQTYLYAIGANYDTSIDNGKPTINPVPGPAAQGYKVASKSVQRKKRAGGGTVFAR